MDTDNLHAHDLEETSLQRVLNALEQQGKPTLWSMVFVGLITGAFAVGASYAVLTTKLEAVPDKFAVQAMVATSMRESPWSHDKARVEGQVDDCLKRIAAVERLGERVLVQHEQIIEAIRGLQSDIRSPGTRVHPK